MRRGFEMAQAKAFCFRPLRLLSFCGCVFLFACSAMAQGQKDTAIKKYLKEVGDFYEALEIVELEAPPDQISPDDFALPSFKLHNKSRVVLTTPVDKIRPSDGKVVYLGYPAWKFTPLDPKLPRWPVTVVGYPVGAPTIDAGGFFVVDQKASGNKEPKLLPGNYRLSVEFHAHTRGLTLGGIQTPVPFLTAAKNFKVTVKASDNPGTVDANSSAKKATLSSSPKKSGATPRDEILRRNDLANQGKSALMDALVVEKLELAIDAVKSGLPLSYGFTISVRPAGVIPDDVGGKTPQLGFTYSVYKVEGAGKRDLVYLQGSLMGQAAIKDLREKKTHTFDTFLKFENKVLQPGSYELVISVWEKDSGIQNGTKNTQFALFKVTR